jgi:BirA family biotin operon repressor/biotin-[acetyl-CoA-carboxylase] ligase
METQLVEILKATGDHGVPLDEAAERLGTGPGRVEALVRDLEAKARAVTIGEDRVIRSGDPQAPLRPGALRPRPPGAPGARAVVVDEVDSTSDEIWRLLDEDAFEPGLVVAAESQTAGRGRGTHRWFSPRGAGLWFSVALVPALPGRRIPFVTQAAGLALSEAIASVASIETALKWPNDLCLAGRKLAGILTEARSIGDDPMVAVLGVGLNVNLQRKGFPPHLEDAAASLREAAGLPLDRTRILDAFLDALARRLADLEAGRIETLDKALRERSAVLGRRVRLREGEHLHEGTVTEQSLEGGLTLVPEGGEPTQLASERIRLVELLPAREEG